MYSVQDLDKLLTPDAFIKIHNIHSPWPKASKWDVQQIIEHHWTKPDMSQALYDAAFPGILKPVSKMPLEDILALDFERFLPDPKAADFPEQCQGLNYAFDCSRLFLSNGTTDARYINAFFDLIAVKIDTLFVSLEEQGQIPPYSKEAWISRGYTFEDWAVRGFWLFASFLHSENFMKQHRGKVKELIHNYRSEMENHSGVSDPFASREAEDDHDLQLFGHMAATGPPTREQLGRKVELDDYIFWVIRILNSHFSIIDRFGRYPYRNDAVGRDFTEDELKWMEDNAIFQSSRLDEETRSRIRKDIEAGTWSPLQGNRDREAEGTGE